MNTTRAGDPDFTSPQSGHGIGARLRGVLWQRLDQPGLERCLLAARGGGWRLSGTVLLAEDGVPVEIAWAVDADVAWRTTAARIDIQGAARDTFVVRVEESNGDRRWRLARGHGDDLGPAALLPAANGRLDIDLGFTPATNTLPIRRLALPIGDGADVTAVWFRWPERVFKPLVQRYERHAPDRWRYLSATGFAADLSVDDLGLVVDYGAIWRQVAVD
ncbi:MAG TPA: putative glycolipid-binding domain-containing protein [Thermomicrobiales bacterium]|nr:putative glycolipid-binding domain-containing protein [Thermomicrobiales bacterium]